MKKRKKNHAERARRKRERRETKRNGKGTIMMTEMKNVGSEKIKEYAKKGAYADLINTFAELAEKGNAPEDCFGDVARAYFEVGDYTRAANWVNSTLTKEPENIDARILLARICQREKRTEDALRLFENILGVHSRAVSYEQRAEIGRRAGIDARLDPEKTRREYPHLAALFGIEGTFASAAPASPIAQAPAKAAPTVGTSMVSAAVSADVQTTAKNILAQEIRPAEKVAALNAFAGGAYIEDKYADAKHLLTEALRLDPGCDETIRNMALLLHDMGEKDKALQVAAKMHCADFMLLRMLKA